MRTVPHPRFKNKRKQFIEEDFGNPNQRIWPLDAAIENFFTVYYLTDEEILDVIKLRIPLVREHIAKRDKKNKYRYETTDVTDSPEKSTDNTTDSG